RQRSTALRWLPATSFRWVYAISSRRRPGHNAKKEGTSARRALRCEAPLGDRTATTPCLALPWTGSLRESVSRLALLTACWPRFRCCRSLLTAQSTSYDALSSLFVSLPSPRGLVNSALRTLQFGHCRRPAMCAPMALHMLTPAMAETSITRTLARALLCIGSLERLAEYLGVSERQLLDWLEGER